MLLVEMIGRESELSLSGSWGTAAAYLAVANDIPLDILLVDLQLPDMGGAELIAKVGKDYPDVCCIVLTSSADQRDVSLAIRSGASGYIVKDSSPKELIDGILSARDGVVLSPKIARLLVEEFRLSPDLGVPKPGLSVLTAREAEVLHTVASGKDTKECATAMGLSYETIRTHLKRIYQKLHVRTRSEAVARLMGY